MGLRLACLVINTVWLAMVLSHILVNKVHNIRANGSLEDRRQIDRRACGFILLIVHADKGAGC